MNKISKNILKTFLLLPITIPAFCMVGCSSSQNEKRFVYLGHIAQTDVQTTFDSEYNGQVQQNVVTHSFYTPQTKEQYNESIRKAKLQSIIINYDKEDTISLSEDWIWYKTTNYFQSLDYYDQNRPGFKEILHMGEILDQVSIYYIDAKDSFYTLITHKILITPNYTSEFDNFWPYELDIRHIKQEGDSSYFEPFHDCGPETCFCYDKIEYGFRMADTKSKDGKRISYWAGSKYLIAHNFPKFFVKYYLNYCPLKTTGYEINYSYFNKDDNDYKSYENFKVKNYMISPSYQTTLFLYKRPKSFIDQKYKFTEIIDTNTISFCENEKILTSNGDLVYKQYPFYHNVFCFPFNTSKYIMEAE